VTTTSALRSAIDAWSASAAPRPPKPVLLLALYQQRLYGRLGQDPALAEEALDRLPPSLRGAAQANVTARAELLSLVSPVTGPIRLRTRPPFPADELLVSFRAAERRFGVAWEILAAVMFVESKFGRVSSASSAGAEGPMQFIPSTWEAYGMGGDVDDPHDAILGAANYLSASGAPDDYRGALYAYNHAWPYVHAISLYARQMMRDPRNYFAYHCWQVYVLTGSGLQRLTGPEL
jgi:soluble lytic murein transglycosylase-like protein